MISSDYSSTRRQPYGHLTQARSQAWIWKLLVIKPNHVKAKRMNLFYFIALFHSWQHKTLMLSWKFNFKKENEINLWSCDTQPSLLSWNRLQTQTALCRSIAFRSASKKHIVLQVRLSSQLSCFVKPLFPVRDFVSLLECGWALTWRNDAVAG